MKKEIQVTAIEITDAPALDPIRVIFQDMGPNQGRVIIECYGKAWANYWGSIGSGGIGAFFRSCNVCYLLDKFIRPKETKSEREYLRKIISAIQKELLE